MNDPTVRPAQFVTARIVIMTTEGEPIIQDVAVVPGTSAEHVHATIRQNLVRDPNIDIGRTEITYPAGPWVGPIDRDIPPIGSVADIPQPRPAPPRPVPPTQQPPRGPEYEKASSGFGPLPSAGPKQGDQAVAVDLQAILDQWRTRHGLTSAAFYHHLALALVGHSGYLVRLERK